MQLTNVIRTISLIGAYALAVTTARAVIPPPDGGYPVFNTAEGDNALFSVTPGIENTAIGFQALFSDIASGDANTATGVDALEFNTTGQNNTANGAFALQHNTTGGGNTATGIDTLFSNIAGNTNTANGASALFNNTTGSDNTATGSSALFSNTTGGGNTATGRNALNSNSTGINNTVTGDSALSNNTTGSSNIAMGFAAGLNLTTGSNNIDLGNVGGAASESGIIRIGTTGTQTATFLAGVRGVAIAGAMQIGVSASGQLGVKASSARFKEAIKPMDKASEVIFSLQPVTFRYKKALDPEALPQFGLVAEQVVKVDPDLVARDVDGKPFTVRYEEVNAMLLNEFLKEHRKVEAQEAMITDVKLIAARQAATIALEKKEIEALTAALKAQAAQIQKVSDRVEATEAAPRLVANNK